MFIETDSATDRPPQEGHVYRNRQYSGPPPLGGSCLIAAAYFPGVYIKTWPSYGGRYNPEGVAPRSPRLLYSATLGRRIALLPNPNGVVALVPQG